MKVDSSNPPKNFGGLEGYYCDYKRSKISVLPVPFGKTLTWQKGSDRGPIAIIEASRRMELYDIETNSLVFNKGISTERPVTAQEPREMIKKVRDKVAGLLRDGKFVVTLGGEHLVAVGAAEAHAGAFKDMSVLHLDAHTDMRDSFDGSKYNNACTVARIKETTKNVVSVGIRSMDSAELKGLDKRRVFFADDILDSKSWIIDVAGKLFHNVYVTIDLDVFDPGIMPSVGTPEPGGLDWYYVTALLKEVAKLKNIVGFDVTELCPNPYNKAPDFMAARLAYKLMSYKFCGKK
jgi:agmatinase